MAALLYLPSGAVSEEGGSVGRARHQGGSAARGLSSTTCKERAKTPRLRGSRSSGQSPFHASAPPQPPPPPIQGHMPLHAHLQQWGPHFLTHSSGIHPETIEETSVFTIHYFEWSHRGAIDYPQQQGLCLQQRNCELINTQDNFRA